MDRLYCLNIFICSLLLLVGCTPKKLTIEKLNKYIGDESNGLIQKQLVGDFNFTLTYKPRDLMIWQDLNGVRIKDDSTISKIAEKYKDYDYYTLNISIDGNDILNHGSASMEMFSQNLQKLSFRMAEYTYAITEKKDTIQLADFYFPRLYGMGGSTQILLAYNKVKNTGEYIDVHLNDIGIGTGRQIFRFKNEDINRIPSLDFLF